MIEDAATMPAAVMTAYAPKTKSETTSGMAPLAMPVPMSKHNKTLLIKPPRPFFAPRRHTTLAGRQEFRTVGRPQRLQPQLHGIPKPQRIAAVVVDGIIGQRVDEDVEAFAVQHQPRHDVL